MPVNQLKHPLFRLERRDSNALLSLPTFGAVCGSALSMTIYYLRATLDDCYKGFRRESSTIRETRTRDLAHVRCTEEYSCRRMSIL